MAVTHRKTPAKEKKESPSYLEMIKRALESLRLPGPASRKGVSVHAIKRFIASNYLVDVNTKGKLINRTLRKAIATGNVIQTKGLTGAVGFFKLPPTNRSRSILQTKSTNRTNKKNSTKKKESPKKKKPRTLTAKSKHPRKNKIPVKAPLKKRIRAPRKIAA